MVRFVATGLPACRFWQAGGPAATKSRSLPSFPTLGLVLSILAGREARRHEIGSFALTSLSRNVICVTKFGYPNLGPFDKQGGKNG